MVGTGSHPAGMDGFPGNSEQLLTRGSIDSGQFTLAEPRARCMDPDRIDFFRCDGSIGIALGKSTRKKRGD